jgi:4-oxalmesaconate hydratase
MNIDCHGHYTTTPAALQFFRDEQLAHVADPSIPAPVRPDISDEEIRSSIEDNQLKMLRDGPARGQS